MKDFTLAKQICKAHGLKGFRKMRLARGGYIAGKQCDHIESGEAVNLLYTLESAGYVVSQRDVCYELADKGLLDCVTIR